MKNIELIIKLIKAFGMKKVYKWLKKVDTSNQHYYIKSKTQGKVYFSSSKADDWFDGKEWIEIK